MLQRKTDKFIKNVLNGRNITAKKNLQEMIEGKIEKRVRQILTKEKKDQQA